MMILRSFAIVAIYEGLSNTGQASVRCQVNVELLEVVMLTGE